MLIKCKEYNTQTHMCVCVCLHGYKTDFLSLQKSPFNTRKEPARMMPACI